LAGLVILLLVLGAACTPATLPVGARRTVDGQVEAHVRSCSDAALLVTLQATDQPKPPPSAPRSTGTIPSLSWSTEDTAWQGTVDGGETSVLIPVELRPDRTYKITVAPATGQSAGLSSDPYVFVAGDLVTDGVTSSDHRGEVPRTPEEFAEATETTCWDNGLGPYLWLFVFVGVIGCLFLGLLTYVCFQIGRSIGRKPPLPPPPPPPPGAVPDPIAPPLG
jgi:hypothetical protein